MSKLIIADENLKQDKSELSRSFEWRDRTGEFHKIIDMETRHLFYTIRMVWNNFMPQEYNVGENIKHYTFNSFYTNDYLKDAVINMFRELVSRKDIKHQWLSEIKLMASYLENKKVTQFLELKGE